MDYNEWGKQYLAEAQGLKGRIASLRGQAASADNETAAGLYRRIALLYDMYLDCLHTGGYLMEYGGGNEKKNELKP